VICILFDLIFCSKEKREQEKEDIKVNENWILFVSLQITSILYSVTFINMAYAITCAQCGQHIIYSELSAIVYYSCGHVEHEDCYFDHHPHNIIYLICGERSVMLAFK
jgi:ribosomal protein S27E